MSGTGNILLKRGTTIPYAHQASEVETASILPKAMPAVQIEGLSYTYDYNATNGGPYARENYQNRLWMGMYGYAATNASIPTAETITSVGQLPVDAWVPNTTGVSRPLWMGAEIRAFIPLKDDNGTDTYFTILKADWNRPSDMVLVTQKAIAYAPVRSYALGTLGSEDIRKYVELSVPQHSTGNDSWTTVASKKLVLPVADPTVGDALTVSTVTSITNTAGTALGEQSHTEIVLTWAAAGAGTPSAVTLTATNDAAAPHFLTFTDAATGVEEIRTDTNLTYNPGTNTLTAVNFAGIASSATVATTVSTSISTDGSAFKIPFTNTTGTANATVGLLTDSVGTDFTYNPNTNTLIVANLAGNASTATQATSVTAAVSSSSSNLPIAFLSATTSTASVLTDSGITYTPSTDLLTVTNISKTAAADNSSFGDQPVVFGGSTGPLYNHTGASAFRFNAGENGGTLYVKNLVVSGTESANIKTNLEVTNTFITLNESLTGAPTETAGILVNRGTMADPELRWNESSDRWEITAAYDNIAFSAITMAVSGDTSTFTVTHTSVGRKLRPGDSVSIRGLTGGNSAYFNGNWYIESVANETTFTIGNKTLPITTTMTPAGSGVNEQYRVETAAHFLPTVGQTITIANTSESTLRGTFKVLGITGTTIVGVANPTTSGASNVFYIGNSNNTEIPTVGNSTGGTVTYHVNANYTAASLVFSAAFLSANWSFPLVHTGASKTDGNIAGITHTTDATIGQPIQTIYNAKLVDPVLENLTLSGSTLAIGLSAYITSLFDIQDGGLILPHMNAGGANNFMDLTSPTANTLVGRTEGNIAYDVVSNRIMYARGVTSTDEEYTSPTATSTLMAELVDTTVAQTLTNKTWNSVVIAGEFGGTGVNNKDKTITLGGNLALVSGAFTTTLTASSAASTNVTLPTSGTLYGTLANSISSANLLSSMSDETGTGVLVFGTSPTFTTSVLSASASTTFDVFNTNATTINAFGAATNLIMGAAGASACITTIRGGTLVGGSNSTTQNVFNTVATTVNAFGLATQVNIGAGGGVVTLANNLTVTGNNIFFKSTTGNRITLTSAVVGSSVTHTLPNITSGNVVIANSSTNFNDSTYILTGGGSTTPSVYKDPATIVVGGVKVNFQNSIATAARYPIPFLGSNRVADGNTDPSAIFSAVADGSYLDSYLYANMSTASGTAAGAYNNLTTGLFYEVNDTSGSGIGTLFCDFIGATLDCGSYN